MPSVSHAAHRSAKTRCGPLRLTLGSQQPPANASTPFPLVQLSSNALLHVAAIHLVPPMHHPSDAACGQIPIEPAASPLPTKRDFVPWRFSDACRRHTSKQRHAGVRETCTKGDYDPARPATSCLLKQNEALWSGRQRLHGHLSKSRLSAHVLERAGRVRVTLRCSRTDLMKCDSLSSNLSDDDSHDLERFSVLASILAATEPGKRHTGIDRS